MGNRYNFKGSSAISYIDYTYGHLEICFNSGSTHRYKCDRSVYDEMKACDSPGSHFHKHIRGKHKEVKPE